MHKNENTNCQFFQNDSEKKNMCNEDYKLNNDIINEENENLIKNENEKGGNVSCKHESKTDMASNNNFEDISNGHLSNDNIEDKIIKNYLNDQINSVNSNINKEKESESQYVEKIGDSNSDIDDLPLLKTYNNNELRTDDKTISKKLKKNEENNEEEAMKKKELLINKENIMNNRKGNNPESEVSSDDECLLNLIKNDNKLDKNTEKLSDKSSYDSDEPILIRSKMENENNNNKIIYTSSENINAIKNSNLNHSNKFIEKKLNNNVKKMNAKKASVSKSGISKGNTTKKINSVSKNKPKKIKKKKINKKKGKIKKKTTENKLDKDYNDNDIENDSIVIGTFDPRNRSNKEKLVAQLLIRWWYVLPDWPLPDYNYEEELKKRKLKLVSLEEYEDKEDIDKDGFRKVYQISAFPGVFRDALGTAYDLRDKNTCPCYNNLIKKTDHELLELICEAIKNQLKSLKNSVYNETYNEKRLEKELKEAELKLSRITKKNKQK
ncbi:conserved Plasmodium protein, unknown function [Plasmodium relictum]|uniref:Uncharacterized protein n=1 Tax=Plasmodium relictum TaxID=85471 RepID=A0A1J1HCU9_PLARL|nr:conserved Plasmodium protein, unknown function [Plasmodium relictum]CRH03747.1 conserved Plasmodium protein, unknown function [Plasmodium relictum]